MNNFFIGSAFMLTDSDLLVETSYGPLFLGEDDFKKFKFDPYWVLDNIDSNYVVELMAKIKQYYIDEAIDMITKGEINYE